MKQFLRFLLILLPSFGGAGGGLYAQKYGQPLIDSLLQALPKVKEDTGKVNLLNGISSGYQNIDPDKGIIYGQQALELATKLDWKNGMANADNRIGANYLGKADNAHALENFEKAIKIFEEINNRRMIAGVLNNMGNVCHAQGDYQHALDNYFKALKINEEIGNKDWHSRNLENISVVYRDQGDYPRALEYDFKALKMQEEIGNKQIIASISANIGAIYQKEGDYDKALEYLFKSLKLDEGISNKNGAANKMENIGDVYRCMGDYPNALEYDTKALKLGEEVGNKNVISNVSCNIATVYALLKNYTLAIENYQRSLIIAEEIGNKNGIASILSDIGSCFLTIAIDSVYTDHRNVNEPAGGKYIPNGAIPAGKPALIRNGINYLLRALAVAKEINAQYLIQDCYENLAGAYKLSGDYKKALEAIDNYRAIKDSVFSKENNEKIVKIGMKDQYDRQRLADSLKTAEKEKITALQLQRQRSYTLMGVTGILLLAGFSFFIVKERGKSEKERKKSDDLLLNILPAEVANELKTTGTTTAKHFENVTVLFTDFVNFTSAGERMSPQALIDELHTCFKKFDEITGRYNIEKIKTIGDAYLAVAGLPSADYKHAENVVRAAIEINTFMSDRQAKLGERTFEIRIGVHSGNVVAGIVGVKKFAYDIWGDTVNTAARMEQNSEPGKINISQTTYDLVKDKFMCVYRGEIDAKNKGMLKMYFIS